METNNHALPANVELKNGNKKNRTESCCIIPRTRKFFISQTVKKKKEEQFFERRSVFLRRRWRKDFSVAPRISPRKHVSLFSLDRRKERKRERKKERNPLNAFPRCFRSCWRVSEDANNEDLGQRYRLFEIVFSPLQCKPSLLLGNGKRKES